MHDIRFCRIDEHDLLIDFLNNHWKKDHVLVLDKELLDWQHLDLEFNRYNFVVAYNRSTSEFDAILGFIPASKFDSEISSMGYIWLAIWKIRDDIELNFSGIDLFFYLRNKLRPKTICAIGITDAVKGIYQAFRFKLGTLSHYFIINKNLKQIIANIGPVFDPVLCVNKSISTAFRIESVDLGNHLGAFAKIKERLPHKSFNYILNRYFRHPRFNYKSYGVFQGENLESFFITRKISVRNSSCIRIIDWVGEFPRANLRHEFEKILRMENAEYIDFMCMHQPDKDPISMGFSMKTENQIVPDYFDPFVRGNVNVSFAYKGDLDNCFIFKGDSDQDRPNSSI